MKVQNLAHSFLHFLASLAVLAAFAVLDWYPTVKDLGRLRRERSDTERKIKDYSIMASSFVFPDAGERSIFAQSAARLLRSLPQAENDAAWLELARSDLRDRAKGSSILVAFSEAEAFGPGPPGLTGWLRLQERDIGRSFRTADARRRYPWRGLFPPESSSEGQLASRPLGVALEAPLPELLDFVNCISWGAVRLEIIHLRLEAVEPLAFAWLVCRGDYFCPNQSAWVVLSEPGNGDGLLVDPDSPLLWQNVDPGAAYRVEKIELPPAAVRGGK